jgi:sulfatase maturation enzyme AslB (radical SAM superfamily)
VSADAQWTLGFIGAGIDVSAELPSPQPSPWKGEGAGIKRACATIKLTTLRELWFHTGTACNLECPFCLEGSKPGDTRLERVTLTDLKPYLDEAVALGVARFAFTGGEPLIVKDIVKILSYALSLKPCLILTNGTAPLIKRVHQLQLLKQQPHALSFRVSIDHPDEQLHDTDRGWGNFKRAMGGIKLLQQSGFEVSIARHAKPDEDAAAVTAHYRELLRKHELPQDLVLAPLPELGRPGSDSGASLTQAELAATPHRLLCASSRMVLKHSGTMHVYACALTDDDTRFDLGPSLANSLVPTVKLEHHRCAQCVRLGVALG